MQLEGLGVPAIAICTVPFESGAKAIAALGSMPDYPFALVQHPIGSLTPEQIRERAVEAAPQVIQSLLARGE
jgi:hypothetical protein